MRIVIFGATGRTGKHLIEQALAQGHFVTAFARDRGKLTIQHERFRVAQGDVLDPVSVERAMESQEVVMCALGHRKGEPFSVLAEGTRHIIQAMKKHGVRRIICVSAAGFLGERADFLIGKALFWYFGRYLQRLFGAMEQQYRELEQSGLEWIAVRPILLDEGPRKGNYRIATQDIPTHGYRITTADVAEFMLHQVQSREYVGKAPAIAY
jgi:putative NADH-flavin reductase